MKKFEIELLRNLEKIELCLQNLTVSVVEKNLLEQDKRNQWFDRLNQEYAKINRKYDSMEPEDVP